MQSISKLAEITGFSREAIRTRISRFNLGENWQPKDILELKPLDEAHGRRKSLEEARAELATEQTLLTRLKREELEGRLADIYELIEAETKMLNGIAGIIRGSSLSDERKEDVFTALQDHAENWRAGHEAGEKVYGSCHSPTTTKHKEHKTRRAGHEAGD
jgi:hypothetical protein